MFGSRCTLKHFKRADIYKNSTGSCIVDLNKKEAWSYSWWQFLKEIDGLLVFNDYCYSSSTSVQQSTVTTLLRDKKIKIDLVVYYEDGLQEVQSLNEILAYQYGLFFDACIESTRSKKSSTWNRKMQSERIEKLFEAGAKITQEKINEIKQDALAKELKRLFDLKIEREEYPEQAPQKIRPEIKEELKDLGPIDFDFASKNMNDFSPIN